MVVPSNEIERMRSDLEQLLPDTCSILGVTRLADGQGGFTESWGTVASNIACRLDNINSREQLVADAIQPFSRWWLTLPYGTNISTANRIVIGSEQYSIIGMDDAKSWALNIRLLVERI